MRRHVSTPIAFESVVKRYRARVALAGVSFAAGAGEITALLGPNGAGKSTALGILATLLRFDAGHVSVAGHALPAEAAAARRVLGFVPQQTAVYPSLTARENIRFFARALGLSRRDAATGSARVLTLLGLADRADEPVGRFSVGMRRRLNLACGIVHAPRVLLLDEPTVGVDPQSRERVFEAVRGLARTGTTVLYSTHIMEEAERLCDRVVLLDAGRVVADGTPQRLVESTGIPVRIRLGTSAALPAGWLGGVPRAAARAVEGGVVVEVPDMASVATVLVAAVRAGVDLVDVAVHRPDLADAFFALTGRALRDDDERGAA
jgi:ABC-2 type transport system ATP-binding protein